MKNILFEKHEMSTHPSTFSIKFNTFCDVLKGAK